MAHRIVRHLMLFTLLLFICAGAKGQEPLTEEDLIRKASTLFEEERWTEALPLYAQLVSVYPENPGYNYRFGVCSLLGSRSDTERPVRYLNVAYRAMPGDQELLFYLGLAYYQDLEFSSALRFFHQSLELTESGSPDRKEIGAYIQSCERGMELLHRNQLDEIISKAEFQYENFHRAYPPDELPGSLIQKPDNFATGIEKKHGTEGFVYVSEPRGVLYFSGYPDDDSKQRDIFRVTLNKKGEWGEPERLDDLVNTPMDEDYPIVADDGATLYFSSKGHNSMGGYDVFRSVYDVQSGAFGTPQNMGIGINSPFDDILYIPDISGRGAFFASNRENQDDNINVYHVTLNEGMVEPGALMAEGGGWQEAGGSWQEAGGSGSGGSSDSGGDDHGVVEEGQLAGGSRQVAGGSGSGSGVGEAEVGGEAMVSVAEAALEPSGSMEKEQLVAAALTEIESSEQGYSSVESLNAHQAGDRTYKSEATGHQQADEKTSTIRQNNALQVNWELVYEQENSAGHSTTKEIETETVLQPARPVSPVYYTDAGNAFPGPEEELEISLETDPVKQVQVVRYAEAQAGILEQDEVLEIRTERDIPTQVKTVAYSMPVSGIAEDEELEIRHEPEHIIPVQLVRYTAAQEMLPEPDEELEIRLETSARKQVEAVEFALRGTMPEDEDETLEITAAPTAALMMAESENQPAGREHPGHLEELTSLTASNGGLLVFPEPVAVPMVTENGASYAELIRRALSSPEALTYEELLFAASLVEDPGNKLRIYNATFIRSERDWRAYYNASIAARSIANPELADVYMYQAGLIYDDNLVGQLETKPVPGIIK